MGGPVAHSRQGGPVAHSRRGGPVAHSRRGGPVQLLAMLPARTCCRLCAAADCRHSWLMRRKKRTSCSGTLYSPLVAYAANKAYQLLWHALFGTRGSCGE